MNGAPFEAFFAADSKRPVRLEQANRAVPGSRFTYARGKLVLWSPTEGLVDSRGEILEHGNFRHLVIANPELAPYGQAAREVLLNDNEAAHAFISFKRSTAAVGIISAHGYESAE
jgi:molybdate transport system substrate-binding protein